MYIHYQSLSLIFDMPLFNLLSLASLVYTYPKDTYMYIQLYISYIMCITFFPLVMGMVCSQFSYISILYIS